MRLPSLLTCLYYVLLSNKPGFHVDTLFNLNIIIKHGTEFILYIKRAGADAMVCPTLSTASQSVYSQQNAAGLTYFTTRVYVRGCRTEASRAMQQFLSIG